MWPTSNGGGLGRALDDMLLAAESLAFLDDAASTAAPAAGFPRTGAETLRGVRDVRPDRSRRPVMPLLTCNFASVTSTELWESGLKRRSRGKIQRQHTRCWHASFPINPSTKREWLDTRISHATILQELGNSPEAESEYRAIIEAAEDIRKTKTQRLGCADQISHAQNNLGNMLQLMYCARKREIAHCEAVAIRKELAEESPHNTRVCGATSPRAITTWPTCSIARTATLMR